MWAYIAIVEMLVSKVKVKQGNKTSRWCIAPVWEDRKELAGKLRVSELVVQLLRNRGVNSFEEAQKFLQPSLNDLIEPERLLGMAAAVKRIRRAISNNEKIVIYGDYDVDGIAGVVILWRCLKLAGVEVEYYVPHRIEEGYGLNVEAMEQLAERGAKLIVTVDCGITARKSVQRAVELGMELIITDHHQIEGQPAPAQVIVHPDMEGQDYANKFLCGAGVAFKLAWALGQEFSGTKKVSDEFREFLLSATALVALGTIADVVPLLGENRLLARFGLEGLAHSEDAGIKAIIKAAGLEGQKLDSSHIGFRLAPKLNAAGRMGHARLAVELFTKSSFQQALEIANYLEGQNRLRQKVEKEITTEAMAQVEQLKLQDKELKGIVVAGEDWHAGVIGIVASRIVDKYHRPAIVISHANGTHRGSCRSVKGFDMCRGLQNCSQHLLSFGGHAMAAGLTIAPNKTEAFRQAFNDCVSKHLSEEDLVDRIDIDAEVGLDELDVAAVEMIKRLEPFGMGNPRVQLVIRNLQLAEQPRRMGKKGAHLQFTVAAAGDSQAHLRPGGIMRVAAFEKAGWEKKLIDAERFDLVFEPTINRYNGNTTVEMIAKDLMIS